MFFRKQTPPILLKSPSFFAFSPDPSFQEVSVSFRSKLIDFQLKKREESRTFREFVIVPHVYNLPVGYHVHSLLSLALQLNPDSCISEAFDNQSLRSFIPHLIADQPTIVDYSDYLFQTIKYPMFNHFLKYRLEKDGFEEELKNHSDIYDNPFADYSSAMFMKQRYFSPISPEFFFVASSEDVINHLYSFMTGSTIDPVSHIFMPWCNMSISDFPPFYSVESVHGSFRLQFILYTLNNLPYLAIMTDVDGTHEQRPNYVIICDGCSKLGPFPSDLGVNILFVGYSPGHYTKRLRVVLPKDSTQFHTTHVKGDTLFKKRIEEIVPGRIYSLHCFQKFFMETLLEPFNFLRNCLIDPSNVYFAYIYYFANCGSISNAVHLISNLGGCVKEIHEKRVWDQYLALQVFAMNVAQLFSCFSASHLAIIEDLVNVVSCVPVMHVPSYYFLLCVMKIAITIQKEINQMDGTRFDKKYHELIIDVVGHSGYSKFCEFAGIDEVDMVSSIELNLDFLSQHLSHTFQVCSTKQKMFSFYHHLAAHNERWNEILFKPYHSQNIMQVLQQFHPPDPYKQYMSKLRVSSPFYL